MKTVRDKAVIIPEDCPGCTICVRVCPTLAIRMQSKLAVISEDSCFGCSACEQACPHDAIVMGDVSEIADPRTADRAVQEPWVIDDRVAPELHDEASAICRRAMFHPEQVLCVCMGARAREVAARILEGSTDPASLALTSGLRSGCTALCTVGIMLLLEAAGHEPPMPPKHHYNWYPGALTQHDLQAGDLDARYGHLGYRFAADTELMEKVGATDG